MNRSEVSSEKKVKNFGGWAVLVARVARFVSFLPCRGPVARFVPFLPCRGPGALGDTRGGSTDVAANFADFRQCRFQDFETGQLGPPQDPLVIENLQMWAAPGAAGACRRPRLSGPSRRIQTAAPGPIQTSARGKTAGSRTANFGLRF